MSDEETEGKVTEEMLDQAAAAVADRLDAILSSLPKEHPDHFASKASLIDRKKKGRHAERGRRY